MIRVLIADDSATARQLLRAIVERDGDLQVVAEAHDGREAVDMVTRHCPDIVLMDVHMPHADGLEATKEIMMRAPTPILIVSSAAHRDVDLSLNATQAGALLAVRKPGSPDSPGFQESARALRDMARAMSQVKVVRRWSLSGSAPSTPQPSLRPREPGGRPELLAIAASTGGPPALRHVLAALPAAFPAPVLIVQHIARDFTSAFADWLAGGSALPVVLGAEGAILEPGTVYVAPDDRHLGVSRGSRIRLDHGPPMNGFRPSASHLFESAGRAYGESLVAVVLTGMGTDGADGLEVARAAGSRIIAQDEASSIVYGMNQEAVRRGLVDEVLALDDMAGRLQALFMEAPHGG